MNVCLLVVWFVQVSKLKRLNNCLKKFAQAFKSNNLGNKYNVFCSTSHLMVLQKHQRLFKAHDLCTS